MAKTSKSRASLPPFQAGDQIVVFRGKRDPGARGTVLRQVPYDTARPEIGDIVVYRREGLPPDSTEESWTYRKNVTRPRETPAKPRPPVPVPVWRQVCRALGKLRGEPLEAACRRIADAGVDETGRDEERLLRWRAARLILGGEHSERDALYKARDILYAPDFDEQEVADDDTWA